MVTLAARPDEIRAAPRRSAASRGAPTRGSVMLMSVGGRLALVAGGIVAVWTTIALALT